MFTHCSISSSQVTYKHLPQHLHEFTCRPHKDLDMIRKQGCGTLPNLQMLSLEIDDMCATQPYNLLDMLHPSVAPSLRQCITFWRFNDVLSSCKGDNPAMPLEAVRVLGGRRNCVRRLL